MSRRDTAAGRDARQMRSAISRRAAASGSAGLTGRRSTDGCSVRHAARQSPRALSAVIPPPARSRRDTSPAIARPHRLRGEGTDRDPHVPGKAPSSRARCAAVAETAPLRLPLPRHWRSLRHYGTHTASSSLPLLGGELGDVAANRGRKDQPLSADADAFERFFLQEFVKPTARHIPSWRASLQRR